MIVYDWCGTSRATMKQGIERKDEGPTDYV
jgi:hypothetical protein